MRTLENKFIDSTDCVVIRFLPNDEGMPDILNDSHFILYIWLDISNGAMKMGEVTKVSRWSPIDAFVNSYSGQKRVGTKIGQLKLLFVGVFSKYSFPQSITSHYDNDARNYIDSFH